MLGQAGDRKSFEFKRGGLCPGFDWNRNDGILVHQSIFNEITTGARCPLIKSYFSHAYGHIAIEW